MSHPICKIGLVTKLSKDHKAECIECKKAGRTKCEFELSQLGVRSLLTHMNSKLHVVEYSERYRQLVEQQNQSSGDQQMSKFVNIIGGGIFLSLICLLSIKIYVFQTSDHLSALDKRVIKSTIYVVPIAALTP
jgi:hypothetical protein